MANIFDIVKQQQIALDKASLGIVQDIAPSPQPAPAQNVSQALASPLPPMQGGAKTGCACEREERLNKLNTRLSIAVHIIALLFFILGVISFLRKSVA